MARFSKLIISCSMLLTLVGNATTATSAPNDAASLQGVWRTTQVVLGGPSPRTLKPGATLAIFYGRHYSRVEVHSEAARELLTDPATASAEQLRATWGPFVGEAGTFDVKDGNVITMQATVAKNPAAMQKGAVSVYTFERVGDVLTLTQKQTSAGPAPYPITITLTRVE